MSSLPAQPYQVSDFSGGLTENFMAGGPTRYMTADNFWVTVDKKLEERYGSQIYDSVNFRLPSANSPVNALIPHDNEAYLLGVNCPNIYVLYPNWLSILGPTGNPPLAGGNYLNAISWGEWSHHTLITDDSLATKPVEIFRGAPYPTTLSTPPTVLNNFMALTAGLPALGGQQNISNAIILAEGILLANDLRTQMIAHINDAVGSVNVELHQAVDTPDLALLTGAPLATDQASLFTLITALIAAYQGHVGDVLTNPISPVYHWTINAALGSLNFYLSSITTPTTLIQAATILDDLKTKFLMHELATFTHDTDNQYSIIGKHLVTAPHIGTITTGPVLVPSYAQSFALATSLKLVYNTHITDITQHVAADTVNNVTVPNASDLDSLYILIAHIRAQYVDHQKDANKVSPTYHVATTTNPAGEEIGQNNVGQFATYSPNSSQFSNWISLLTQAVTAYDAHDNGTVAHYLGGLHQVYSGIPVIASYSYALHYFYQYIRYDGVIFNVVGPVTYLGPIQTEMITEAYNSINPSGGGALPVAASTVSITNIPVLQNGGQDNYDTTNVQIKIFRTIDSGSTYYFDGIIPNGVTNFLDNIPDVANPALPAVVPLNQQVTIYTSGGVVNFDPPPVCKYITIMQNTAYYGAIIDTGQTFLNRIRQSIQNTVYSSPGAFFIDLPDILMGISNTRNNLVALCANSCYQISGAFNELGQGQLNYQAISDSIGCVSSESIVRTDVGVFFAGTDGFYYTDGFQLIKLSSEFNLTYAALISNAKQKAAIYGCYDRYNRRVWWSTQKDPSGGIADSSYIFHVNFGVTAAGVFTTASNFTNYQPSSMIFWQGKQIRGDSRGYIFLHSIFSKTDPQVNIHTSPLTWNTVYIPYNYSSCALDFGTTFQRKWLTRISVQGKNVGNVGAVIMSKSDNGRVPPLTLAPLWFHPNIYWGFPTLTWGKPNSQQPIVWGNTLEMDMWRRFPATQLRADYKQIIIQPTKIGVYRYQDYPVGAGVNIIPSGSGTAQIQLLTPAPYTALNWPLDVVGYVFSQQGDNYTAEYPITAITTLFHPGDTLIVSDPGNVLVSSSAAWVIRGILKQQRLSLTSYNIHFTLLGKMQQAYHGSQDAGENFSGAAFAGDALLTEGSDFIDTESGQRIITED